MNKIYIYTNETYREKNWYKIGETSRLVDDRIKEQDTTSNPEPLLKVGEFVSILSDTEIHKILLSMGFLKTRDDANREWFKGFNSTDEVISVINEIISKSGEDTRPTYEPRFYQYVVKEMFLDKLNIIKNDKYIDFALELAPRFGKTIWSIDLIKSLYDDYGYRVCVLPTYFLSSLTSFKKEFNQFNGYSEEMVYITTDDDIDAVIKENYGKKMIIIESSLHMNNHNDKLKSIIDLPSEDKVCFMDEADFGTHREKSQDFIRDIGAKLNVYMTGTAIEKVTNPLENLGDNVIRWSYTDMLLVKSGEHPLQKYLV